MVCLKVSTYLKLKRNDFWSIFQLTKGFERLTKIFERLTQPLKDWPKPLKDWPKPLKDWLKPLKDWPNHWRKRVTKIFEKLISFLHFWIFQEGEIGNQVFLFWFFNLIFLNFHFEVAQNRGVLIFCGWSSRFGQFFNPPSP